MGWIWDLLGVAAFGAVLAAGEMWRRRHEASGPQRPEAQDEGAEEGAGDALNATGSQMMLGALVFELLAFGIIILILVILSMT